MADLADPGMIGAVSMGATALGGGVAAYGAMEKGKSNAQMYNYKAGVAQINQQLAEQNADYQLRAGEIKAQHSGMKTAQQVGAIRAAQSGSNLDINSGTVAQVRESQHDIGIHDQETIRANAARAAYGYEIEAVKYKTEQGMNLTAAKQSKRAGTIDAIASLLGTAGSVSGKWMQGSQAGMWGSKNKLGSPHEYGHQGDLYG